MKAVTRKLDPASRLHLGEQDVFAAIENDDLDDLLADLGSAMSLENTAQDPGFNDTVPAQIITQPGLTEGVAVIDDGNVNSISSVPAAGGTNGPLLLAKDPTSVRSASEALRGGGEVVLLADANLLSNLDDEMAMTTTSCSRIWRRRPFSRYQRSSRGLASGS